MITKPQAKELLEILMGKENDYAEVFIESKKSYSFHNFNNERFTPNKSYSDGTGFRTWKGDEVSYLSIDSICYEELKNKAIEFSGGVKNKEVQFINTHENFTENDFGEWGNSEIKNRLIKLVDLVKKQSKKITVASSMVRTIQKDRLIATSDGSFIKKTSIYSNVHANAQAQDGANSESAGHYISKLATLKSVIDESFKESFLNEVKRMSKLSVDLLKANRIPSGDMKVILPNGFGAVLFHEAVGHPLEATAIARNKSKFAGKIGQKVASDLVTLIDDGTIQGEVGSSDYDDEGVKNRRRVLIENGILKSYLIDKFNGEVLMKKKPNGSGRRESYRYNNTSRMSNTFLQNGSSKVSEIIEATDYGFYAKKLGGGQVDPFTGQFNFGVVEGYIVRNGKITELVKNATLIGNGMDALFNIDMVGDDFEISPGNCGSSSGYIPVTCGQPTLRISKMTVGGK